MKFIIKLDVEGLDHLPRQEVATALLDALDYNVEKHLMEHKAITNLCEHVKNAYEDGVCPDCGEPIPDDAVDGVNCANCGHVFYMIDNLNISLLLEREEPARVAVDHLTVYIERCGPRSGVFHVDQDYPDDMYGSRSPGNIGSRFSEAEDAAKFIASELQEMNQAAIRQEREDSQDSELG